LGNGALRVLVWAELLTATGPAPSPRAPTADPETFSLRGRQLPLGGAGLGVSWTQTGRPRARRERSERRLPRFRRIKSPTPKPEEPETEGSEPEGARSRSARRGSIARAQQLSRARELLFRPLQVRRRPRVIGIHALLPAPEARRLVEPS